MLNALHPYSNELMKGISYENNANRDGGGVVDPKRMDAAAGARGANAGQ
jgi:hypothetical protein